MPPISARLANYSEAGTDVMVNLRFLKVDSVDVAAGHLRVRVWWRSTWKDERLAWNPVEFGGIQRLPVRADADGSGDVWLPDLTVYNTREAISTVMEPALAHVNHEGVVFWTRAGFFDVMCRFSGLVSSAARSPKSSAVCVRPVLASKHARLDVPRHRRSRLPRAGQHARRPSCLPLALSK